MSNKYQPTEKETDNAHIHSSGAILKDKELLTNTDKDAENERHVTVNSVHKSMEFGLTNLLSKDDVYLGDTQADGPQTDDPKSATNKGLYDQTKGNRVDMSKQNQALFDQRCQSAHKEPVPEKHCERSSERRCEDTRERSPLHSFATQDDRHIKNHTSDKSDDKLSVKDPVSQLTITSVISLKTMNEKTPNSGELVYHANPKELGKSNPVELLNSMSNNHYPEDDDSEPPPLLPIGVEHLKNVQIIGVDNSLSDSNKGIIAHTTDVNKTFQQDLSASKLNDSHQNIVFHYDEIFDVNTSLRKCPQNDSTNSSKNNIQVYNQYFPQGPRWHYDKYHNPKVSLSQQQSTIQSNISQSVRGTKVHLNEKTPARNQSMHQTEARLRQMYLNRQQELFRNDMSLQQNIHDTRDNQQQRPHQGFQEHQGAKSKFQNTVFQEHLTENPHYSWDHQRQLEHREQLMRFEVQRQLQQQQQQHPEVNQLYQKFQYNSKYYDEASRSMLVSQIMPEEIVRKEQLHANEKLQKNVFLSNEGQEKSYKQSLQLHTTKSQSGTIRNIFDVHKIIQQPSSSNARSSQATYPTNPSHIIPQGHQTHQLTMNTFSPPIIKNAKGPLSKHMHNHPLIPSKRMVNEEAMGSPAKKFHSGITASSGHLHGDNKGPIESYVKVSSSDDNKTNTTAFREDGFIVHDRGSHSVPNRSYQDSSLHQHQQSHHHNEAMQQALSNNSIVSHFPGQNVEYTHGISRVFQDVKRPLPHGMYNHQHIKNEATQRSDHWQYSHQNYSGTSHKQRVGQDFNIVYGKNSMSMAPPNVSLISHSEVSSKMDSVGRHQHAASLNTHHTLKKNSLHRDNLAGLYCKCCDKMAKFVCAACKRVAYCSIRCQTQEWPSHRNHCSFG